ncbi:hypothetical protein [Halobaculum sp. EA56]|uniref:hypothetical protein n=1 Tax=Halobaculum sp. EA56 TaxID=3421648 RepID=UPI003EBA02D1
MADPTDPADATASGGGPLSVVVLLLFSVGFLGAYLFGWRGTERFVDPLGVPVDPTVGFLGSFLLIGVASGLALLCGDS